MFKYYIKTNKKGKVLIPCLGFDVAPNTPSVSASPCMLRTVESCFMRTASMVSDPIYRMRITGGHYR